MNVELAQLKSQVSSPLFLLVRVRQLYCKQFHPYDKDGAIASSLFIYRL